MRREARTTGVLLMTYGAAKTPEDVPDYLNRVYRGKAPRDLVEEFQRRYRLVGGSPLVEITRSQAAALERALNDGADPDQRYVVEAGMRNTPPFIGDALGDLADAGCEAVVAVVMSPQYSPIIMGGYRKAIDAAHEELGLTVPVRVAGPWHDSPLFLDALAARVRAAMERLPPEERETVPVLLTAHSLPLSVVDKEPGYLDQIMETAHAVAERAGIGPERWQFAYQSAGHAPEPWLTPDMKDLLPGLAEQGYKNVLMVPVQFVADHLETLYDIDVAAREEAEEARIGFHRIEMFNASLDFVRVLADVVLREEADLRRMKTGEEPQSSQEALDQRR